MTDSKPSRILLHSFGDPEPVLDGHSLFEYGFCPAFANWYDLPYDMAATAKLYRATSHHTSALVTKRNILTTGFIPHPLLSRQAFAALAQDLLVFSNCYLEVIRSRLGGILQLRPRPAKYMRRGTDLATYYQLANLWSIDAHQFVDERAAVAAEYGDRAADDASHWFKQFAAQLLQVEHGSRRRIIGQSLAGGHGTDGHFGQTKVCGDALVAHDWGPLLSSTAMTIRPMPSMARPPRCPAVAIITAMNGSLAPEALHKKNVISPANADTTSSPVSLMT